MDSRALRLVSKHTASLTTIASKLAPTIVSQWLIQLFLADVPGCGSPPAASLRDNSIIFALRAAVCSNI